jgi:competence protein ComEC
MIGRSILLLLFSITLYCNIGWKERPADTPVTFAVFDVGQGLAQAVTTGGKAVLFDIGPPEAYPKWKEQFDALGSPVVEAIVLSHDHLDHWGGLQQLDSALRWTGLVVTSSYEDTAFIRNAVPQWRDRVRFRIIAAHDTLRILDGIEIKCLWPPAASGDSLFRYDSLKNRYSLVFSLTSHATNALITSDIDTVAERELSLCEQGGLGSNVMVVPHHGSAGSLDQVFYGYVRPQIAILSCGAENPYGHPSGQVLLLLSQMGVVTKLTSINGEILMESNGYDWEMSATSN